MTVYHINRKLFTCAGTLCSPSWKQSPLSSPSRSLWGPSTPPGGERGYHWTTRGTSPRWAWCSGRNRAPGRKNDDDWNDWCFRPRFCNVKLYWAGDNLGERDEFCYEWCPWCRICTMDASPLLLNKTSTSVILFPWLPCCRGSWWGRWWSSWSVCLQWWGAWWHQWHSVLPLATSTWSARSGCNNKCMKLWMLSQAMILHYESHLHEWLIILLL